MKNKRFLSTVVASALVATTMAVPVMAADGGSMDVNVTTKAAVIRVQVPTTMAIAVNQFEMGDSGSQIYSSDFSMENKSEIPVKVNVESTAELKSTTKLLGTKAAAGSSTAAGEAWIAVAAKTGASSYADGTATTVADLTESNKNVTTFVQGTDADAAKGKAAQMFYLDKSDNMAYKLLNAGEDASKIDYAQFYELTAKTVANADAYATLIADNDIYVATAAAADGQALTKVAKGDSNHTFDSGEIYYTADENATAKTAIDAAKLYVYGDGAAATKGAAAFRYIGKLSGEQETWTKDDISKVTIKYDITGVTATKFDDVKDDCVYGLYPTASAVTPGLTYVSGKDNSDVVLQFTAPEGKTLATNYAKVNGIDASSWGSFGSNFTFNTTANTVTIKAAVFGFNSVSNATTDHKYVFTVKDSDGTEYSTAEVDLTP